MSATSAAQSTAVPALVCRWPSTLTCPARISARARSRDGARPLSTTSWSSRTRNVCNLERLITRVGVGRDPSPYSDSIRSFDDPAADLQQPRTVELHRCQRRCGALETFARHALREFEPIERRIRGLA